MLAKKEEKTRLQVTFVSPMIPDCECVYLVGDFNNWSVAAHPMEQVEGDTWSLTINLEPGKTYQYRYYTNNGNWLNNSDVDDYYPSPFGAHNSVLTT
jgi:1,4-alpha-glucan branching enzyme